MSTIIQYIQSIVSQMTGGVSPAATPEFIHGTKGWQNLLADEANYANGVIFMDDAIQAPLKIEKTGYITETYPLLIAILLKGNLDDTPDQQQIVIQKAAVIMREFISRLFNDDKNTRNFKNISMGYVINMKNANLHGVALGITFDFYNESTICV